MEGVAPFDPLCTDNVKIIDIDAALEILLVTPLETRLRIKKVVFSSKAKKQFSTFAPLIPLLPSVTKLDLSKLDLVRLPSFVVQMGSQLVWLDISENNIKRLPSTMTRLTHLQAFYGLHTSLPCRMQFLCGIGSIKQSDIGGYYGSSEALERHAVIVFIGLCKRRKYQKDVIRFMGRLIWESYVNGDFILDSTARESQD